MALLEAIIVFVASIASVGTIMTLYFRMADQWLNTKSEQLENVIEHKFFSFLESLKSASKVYETQVAEKGPDDPIAPEEYEELMNTIGSLGLASAEYSRWEGALLRIALQLRNGAKYWIIVGLLAGGVSVLLLIGFSLEFSGVDYAILIELCLCIVIAVFVYLALKPLFHAVSQLNDLDNETLGLTPTRTWTKRKKHSKLLRKSKSGGSKDENPSESPSSGE
ncbi:MAG: hypothetical protein ACXADD_17385 [Candidatus Thorarchaeota archaeon]